MMAAVKVSKQKLPTYLKEFLREDDEIVLVSKQISPRKSPHKFQEEWSFNSDSLPLSLNNLSNNESALDLTGNPLKVDLDESVLVTEQSMLASEKPPNWTIEESHHIPLDLHEARDLLNEKLNRKGSSSPTLCVTDGKDTQKTVIIGSQNLNGKLKTYLGKIVGMFPQNAEELSMEYLKKEHNKYVRTKADSTECICRRIYNIQGFNLQEMPALEYAKFNGCMVFETYWNTFSKEEPDISKTGIKMILKVVSGHKTSSIRSLWDQLGYLEKYLRILSDQEAVNDANTVVSDDPLPISDLNDKLHTLCDSSSRKIFKIKSNTLDFNNLREETVLDNLWFLLNRCQNLTDLKNSLSTFLRNVKLENFYSRDSTLADLVGQCLKSSDFVSKLSFAESLKLLVYIGFEKLKQDYFTIIDFFLSVHLAPLEKTWSEFSAQPQQKSRRLTTAVKNFPITDTSFNDKKMAFLIKLHDVAEILAFLKQDTNVSSTLSTANLNLIRNHVYNKFFNTPEKTGNFELRVKLLEVFRDLKPDNKEIYENKTPVVSIVEMTSNVNTSEIKTIFHISQHPIFPKSIYDDYGQGGDRSSLNSTHIPHQLLYFTMLAVFKY